MQCIKRRVMEAKDESRKLRESTGMNRKEFCEYFEIPYRMGKGNKKNARILILKCGLRGNRDEEKIN